VKITSGEQTADLAKIIKNDFKSNYVLIGKDHPTMEDNFSRDDDFKLVYEDDDAWVYKTMSHGSDNVLLPGKLKCPTSGIMK